MSHCLLIYLPSCARNLDTEQTFARSLASCVIYNHVSSFIKKSVSGAGAGADTAAFHPLCAKQGSPSPGEECAEGRGVGRGVPASARLQKEPPQKTLEPGGGTRQTCCISHSQAFLSSFRTNSQSLTCRKKKLKNNKTKALKKRGLCSQTALRVLYLMSAFMLNDWIVILSVKT